MKKLVRLLNNIKKYLLDIRISSNIRTAQTGDKAAQIKAGRLLENALKLEPNNPKYHNNYANILGGGGSFGTRAIIHMMRAIELDPQNADYWLNLGKIFNDTWAREISVYCIGVAEAINPNAIMIYKAKNNILKGHAEGGKYGEIYSEEKMNKLTNKAKEAYIGQLKTKSIPLKRGELEKFLSDLKGGPYYEIQ